MERKEIIEKINRCDVIEVAGPCARSMKHGICVYKNGDKLSKFVFISTEEEKLQKIEEQVQSQFLFAISLSKQIHQNAVDHGWWDEPRGFGEIIALIHSEWSEALEEYRAGRGMLWYATDAANKKKPEGIAVELIDGCIRILDYFGKEGGTIQILPVEMTDHLTVPNLVATLHCYTTYAMQSKEDEWRGWFGAAVYACFSYIQANGLSPEKIMLEKHEYNITRPYKHGKVC